MQSLGWEDPLEKGICGLWLVGHLACSINFATIILLGDEPNILWPNQSLVQNAGLGAPFPSEDKVDPGDKKGEIEVGSLMTVWSC